VMASGWIVCQVELLPGNAQIAIAIEMEDTPVHHGPKILEPCIPSPVQPIGEIPTDLAVNLFVGTDTGLIEIGEHPKKEAADIQVWAIDKKIDNDHMDPIGEFVHPGQPVLPPELVCQIVKNVGESRKNIKGCRPFFLGAPIMEYLSGTTGNGRG